MTAESCAVRACEMAYNIVSSITTAVASLQGRLSVGAQDSLSEGRVQLVL
jgi:hypothetical protein